MIFCIPCLALILYFTIASIFFPRYRIYIKDGWHCFLDKLRGKRCSVSFDNRMRLALSMWLTKMGMVRLGRIFYKERNFNITLTAVTIVLTIISMYFFILLIKFLILAPCTNGVCMH